MPVPAGQCIWHPVCKYLNCSRSPNFSSFYFKGKGEIDSFNLLISPTLSLSNIAFSPCKHDCFRQPPRRSFTSHWLLMIKKYTKLRPQHTVHAEMHIWRRNARTIPILLQCTVQVSTILQEQVGQPICMVWLFSNYLVYVRQNICTPLLI